MITFSEYRSRDALGLAGLVQAGDVTATELLEAALARAAAVNPQVNAAVHLDPALGMRSAAAVDIEAPLAGVPYLLKDLTIVAHGLPLTNGSLAFGRDPPARESETAARLRRAGLVVFGRTNSPEFGLTPTTEPLAYGPARNPWSLAHSAGGSSGGAAAAVAAGIVPAAHATDTMGSIRAPASCCGLFGLKPTRGLVPTGPFRGDANQGLSHEHCISRTVRDSAALLDAVSGRDPGAPWFTARPAIPYLDLVRQDPARLRIGLCGGEEWVELDPACAVALAAAGRSCEQAGHSVEPVRLPFDPAEIVDCAMTIVLPGIAAVIEGRERELGHGVDHLLEPLTLDLARRWGRTSANSLLSAVARLNVLVRTLAAVFDQCDVVLTPTLPEGPPRLGSIAPASLNPDSYGEMLRRWGVFTSIASATGQPAANLPLFLAAGGLPIGVQALGRFGEDAVLLQLAAQLEKQFIGQPLLASA